MTNKKIAFKPHETRGQEIIKILEGMGGINKYNLDGSKGIIAIDNVSTKTISNDWDVMGLWRLGYEVYTLETWEEKTKPKMVNLDKVLQWLKAHIKFETVTYSDVWDVSVVDILATDFTTVDEMEDSFRKAMEE